MKLISSFAFITSFYSAWMASALLTPASSIAAANSTLNTARIEQLTGEKGKYNEKESVFKVSLPRKGLKIEVQGVKVTPPLGLTAWTSFTKAGSQTMVMGDIVLTESQVNPVMSAALENGLEVTALHNHFLWDAPKVMFMHIGGMGAEEQLASGVGKVFSKLKETVNETVPAKTNIDPAKTSLNPKRIEKALGYSGEFKDGVYKVTIGRATQMHGHEIGSEMGINTWAAFAGSDEKAVVDGDFAMLESELQPVLKALRKSGLEIVAIHNHMTMENPRIMFLHFWGAGSTEKLARGIRSALEQQALKQK